MFYNFWGSPGRTFEEQISENVSLWRWIFPFYYDGKKTALKLPWHRARTPIFLQTADNGRVGNVLSAYSSLMVVNLRIHSVRFMIFWCSVFQAKVWISSHSGDLAVGEVKTDFQNGKVTDPSNRNKLAKLPADPVGECRLVKVATL